jgi:cbb3-type cytochrome oxidase subunit 3
MLSEAVSHADMTLWPQVALVIFVVVFLAILARVMSRRRDDEYVAAARLPLGEDEERRDA